MVILKSPSGGLSNRLIQNVHLQSFCLEKDVTFINPFLSSFWLRFPKILRQLRRVDALQFMSIDSDYSEHERLMTTRPIVFVEGWAYRNKPLTIKYRDYYRGQYYRGKPAVDAQAILSRDKTNIALHIRRGDYATWREGIYFFPDAVYLSAVNQLLRRLIRRPARIIIFTDDASLDYEAFQRAFGDVVVSRHSASTDHYLMSLCDYIIGPPSTFSQWASYIGGAMYCHIHSPDQIIDRDCFQVCDG